MTNIPEREPWPKFPEEVKDNNPYWLLRLMEFVLPSACPMTFALENQVHEYLFRYVRPAVNKLGAELNFVDGSYFFYPGEVVRIFYISGFKQADEPKIKEILVKNKIDWPMSIYQSDKGRTVHIVMCRIEEYIEKKKEVIVPEELPLALTRDA